MPFSSGGNAKKGDNISSLSAANFSSLGSNGLDKKLKQNNELSGRENPLITAAIHTIGYRLASCYFLLVALSSSIQDLCIWSPDIFLLQCCGGELTS